MATVWRALRASDRPAARERLRLGFLGRLVALCFEFGVLISRKNSFRLLQESCATFFRASRLRALRLPGLNLRLLIGREIETRQIGACGLIGGILCATRFTTCESWRCYQHRCRYYCCSEDFNHGEW